MQVSIDFYFILEVMGAILRLIPWKKNHAIKEKLHRTVVVKEIISVLRLYVHFGLSLGCH